MARPPALPTSFQSASAAGANVTPVTFFVSVAVGVLGCLGGVAAVCGVTLSGLDAADNSVAMTQSDVSDDDGTVGSRSMSTGDSSDLVPGETTLPSHRGNPADDEPPDQSNSFDVPEPDMQADDATDAQPTQDEAPAATGPPQTAETSDDATPQDASDDGEAPASSGNAAGPLDDVRSRDNRLMILSDSDDEDLIPLCRIAVNDPQQLELELIDAQFKDTSQTVLQLTRGVESEANEWSVRQQASVGIGRKQELGRFRLQDGMLGFSWEPRAGRRFLPFCRLKLTATQGDSQDSEVCSLSQPVTGPPLQLTFKSPSGDIELLSSGLALPPTSCLHLELELDSISGADLSPSSVVEAEQPIEVALIDLVTDDDLFTTTLQLHADHDELRFHYEHSAVIPGTSSRPGRQNKRRQKISVEQLEKMLKRTSRNLDRLQRMLADKSEEQTRLEERATNGQGARSPRGRFAPGSPALQKQMQRLEEECRELEDRLAETEQLPEWLEAALTACEDIESDGKVHYRLFRKPDNGDEIDIVTSQPAE